MKNSSISCLMIFCVSLWGGESAGSKAEGAERMPLALSGRVRSLSMARDYEGKGSGENSTLGLMVHAEGELSRQVSAGATYIYAEEVYAKGQSDMLSNNDFHLLNEAWLRFEGPQGMTGRAGRIISNGEIFREDDSRQKPRAVEALTFSREGLTLGHALRMSHYLQSGDRWDFNPFDEVFRVGDESEGVSWVEGCFPLSRELEIGMYDAVAWRISNLTGSRVQWTVCDSLTVLGYLRWEKGLEDQQAHSSETYGISLQKSWGKLKLEPGFLSVHGDKMLFQETTTGFNHALASCMIIYACPFDGGADTFYLKATSKLGHTGLYLLGMYSRHDQQPFDAEEVNLVLKHPLGRRVDLACKVGLGYRENDQAANTTASDLRLFVTCVF